MVSIEHDVIQAGDMLVIRGSYEVTHTGEFLGVPPPAGGSVMSGSTCTG
jgi:predicted ester cyclase